MHDISLSQHLVFRLEDLIKNIRLGQFAEHRELLLDDMAKNVGKSLADIHNEKVAQTVVGEYRKFVKATEVGTADSGNNWNEEQNAIWNNIVAPYKGNTLILDFWSMGCGPCRGGMLSQRKIVEEMKDEKVKFLYVNTENEKGNAEKWMEENSIRGEHVYVTKNEWKQLQAMLNFSAIPFGALAGKDGKLIQGDFHVGQFNSTDLKNLTVKF